MIDTHLTIKSILKYPGAKSDATTLRITSMIHRTREGHTWALTVQSKRVQEEGEVDLLNATRTASAPARQSARDRIAVVARGYVGERRVGL